MMLLGFSDAASDANCDAGTVYNDFYGACVNECPVGQAYDANGICVSTAAQPGATPAGSNPWWGTALTSLVKGAAQGLVQPKSMMPIAPPTPWYQTPIGIGGIVLGLVAGYMVLKK